MADTRDDEVRSALEEIVEGGMRLLRSAAHSHNGFRDALDAVQMASEAAKEDNHNAACDLLSRRIVAPISDVIRAALPKLVTGAIQTSVQKSFPKLVKETLTQQLTDEIVRDLVEKTVAGYLRDRVELERAIQGAVQAAQETNESIRHLIDASQDGLVTSLAAPGFGMRLQEQATVKSEIGRRVAEVFFSETRRPSFVMASSTAVHFGQQLRRQPDAVSTRFATNSIAFPLAVLNDRSEHEVLTWCGPIYDDQCGGWWPNLGDDPFFRALENAFSVNSFGLRTAILTPRKLAIESGMHFTRAESAKMARGLVTSAAEVILMLPADRICQSLEKSELAGAFPGNGDWRDLGKPIHLVVAGQPAVPDFDATCRVFAERGLRVHFQRPESAEWHVL